MGTRKRDRNKQECVALQEQKEAILLQEITGFRFQITDDHMERIRLQVSANNKYHIASNR